MINTDIYLNNIKWCRFYWTGSVSIPCWPLNIWSNTCLVQTLEPKLKVKNNCKQSHCNIFIWFWLICKVKLLLETGLNCCYSVLYDYGGTQQQRGSRFMRSFFSLSCGIRYSVDYIPVMCACVYRKNELNTRLRGLDGYLSVLANPLEHDIWISLLFRMQYIWNDKVISHRFGLNGIYMPCNVWSKKKEKDSMIFNPI